MDTISSNIEHRITIAASTLPAADTRLGVADLTPRMEAFAALVAQGSALNAAYRQTHDVGDDTKRTTVNENAHKLAKRCAGLIRQLRDEINEHVVIKAADLRTRQSAIAFAPALTHTKAFNCRHCYASPPRATQWDDMGHYCEALAEYAASLTSPKPLGKPLYGGVGYDHFAPPNPRCRSCRGVGERFVYGPQDTTQLDSDMTASYRGAAVDPRTGVVKIEQADPDAALRELTAMTPGGYAPKQSESKAAVEHTHRVVPAELTVEEARAALARHRRAPVTIEQPPAAQDNAP
jgi:hypothetical protein